MAGCEILCFLGLTSLGDGSVTFASGVAVATVDVHAIHDGLIDPDETVEVTITSGTGYIIGAEFEAELVVIDTDILPVAFDGLATTSVNQPVVVDLSERVAIV